MSEVQIGARIHRPFYVTSKHEELDLNVDILHKHQITQLEITAVVKIFLTSRTVMLPISS